MAYILLVIAASGITTSNFMAKQFNTNAKVVNTYLYSAIATFFSTIFFLICSGGNLCFTYEILPYSIIYGAIYGITFFSLTKAMKYGPISLTAFASSISLIIPTLYGVVMLDDPFGIIKFTGFILLILALVLITVKKGDAIGFSSKWLVLAILTFLGNGTLSILQKIQQMKFDGRYKSEFLIISFAIVCVTFLILGLRVQGSKKKMIAESIKYAAPAGIANGVLNFLVLMLTSMLPTAILFPSLSAINMTLTFILALLIFKEKLSKAQTTGYVLGVISVVLLNI